MKGKDRKEEKEKRMEVAAASFLRIKAGKRKKKKTMGSYALLRKQGGKRGKKRGKAIHSGGKGKGGREGDSVKVQRREKHKKGGVKKKGGANHFGGKEGRSPHFRRVRKDCGMRERGESEKRDRWAPTTGERKKGGRSLLRFIFCREKKKSEKKGGEKKGKPLKGLRLP